MYHIEIDNFTWTQIRDLLIDSRGRYFPGAKAGGSDRNTFIISFDKQNDAMTFYNLLQDEFNVTATFLICV